MKIILSLFDKRTVIYQFYIEKYIVTFNYQDGDITTADKLQEFLNEFKIKLNEYQFLIILNGAAHLISKQFTQISYYIPE